MEPRVIQLEEKVAHLERHVAELDGVVHGLYERMQRFEAQVKALRALAQAAPQPGGPDGAKDQDLEDERPPHW